MIRTLLRRLALLAGRRRAADDLEEEMRLHVELRAARYRREGLGTREASRRARLRFGNQLKLREESRDEWGFTAMERTIKDVRYAARQLMRRPAWTLTVLMTLALGIGANTSIFTLVNGLLFRPLPVHEPDRLLWVAIMEGQSGHVRSLSYPGYLDLRDRTTTLSGLAAFHGTYFSVGGQRAERVTGDLVSGNYFDVLGIRATIGRTFAPEEDATPGAHPVVVVSDRLWRDRFGADPRAIGSTAVINGRPFTIVGVAPRGFAGVDLGESAELWIPLAMQAQAMPSEPPLLAAAGAGWLRAVGRLREQASVAQADAELRGLSLQTQPPGTRPDQERLARATPIRSGLDPGNRNELVPVVGLVAIVPALVLLVACLNVANVLMAHHVGRRKEFAMRRAIGATRARLVGQLLVESLLLALLAAASGVIVSFALTAAIVQLGDVPGEIASVLHVDGRVLAGTTALAMLTTLVFGLAPALTATRFDLLASIKDDGLTVTPGAGRRLFRGALVVAQVTVSLSLLITAGLFLRSLSKAIGVDPGFEPRGAAVLSVDPALQGYTRGRQDAYSSDLVARALALPGVTAASVTSAVPLAGRMMGTDVAAEGRASRVAATFSSIAPRYFESMRIDLVRGRDFIAADAAAAPPVAIVNETLARRLWPDGDAIGKRLRTEAREQPPLEVIGIVRDGKYRDLTERPRAALYFPIAQRPASPITLVVRTAGDPRSLVRQLTDAAGQLDPDMPLYRAQTLEEMTGQVVSAQRSAASLLGVFGAITLLLAAVGIYGVASHSVSVRTREIGIRLSLGARATDVLGLFVRETLMLAAIGTLVGLVASVGVSQVLSAFLFGLTATDGMSFAAATVVVGVVSTVAGYLPARRASRIAPIVALRD